MISQFFFLLQIVAPIFLTMVAGYVLRKRSVLTAEADRSLISVAVTFLAPCLALSTIIGNEALRLPANWLIPPIAGFLSCVLGILGARLGVYFLKSARRGEKRTFVFTTSIQNYGYLTIPLCNVLFDRETTGVLFAFILGVDLAFWSIVLWQLTGRVQEGSWRKALSPPLVATVAAMILNGLDAAHWLPSAVLSLFHFVGQCAVPMSLILSGALIADYMNFKSLRTGGPVIAMASLIRLGLVPAILMIFAKYLPIDEPLKAVLMLQAAMPAAIFPIVITKVYYGDVPTALQVVLGTSLLGLLTIPLWLGFGLWWIPLPHN